MITFETIELRLAFYRRWTDVREYMAWRQPKELDEKQIQKLLRMTDEQDWLEFKSEMKLFTADGKIAEKPRDEFIKDILGLANGNCHTIRKTKYLIVGADNKAFDENKERVRYSVEYRLPTQSEIAKWLKSACTPAVVGVECEKICYKGDWLFVIKIHPTFDLHETARALTTPNATYPEHTVFMRQDEHIFTASVQDGITIQQLKHLHRQEVANPPALFTGAITGGVVGLITGQAKIQATLEAVPGQEVWLLPFLVILGIFFGVAIGYFTRSFNEVRYDWRYMTWKQRFFTLAFVIVSVAIYVLIVRG